MCENLVGKKILFIGTPFYGYEKQIKKNLENNYSCFVTYFPDCPRNIFVRFLRNLSTNVYRKFVLLYHKYILNKVDEIDFDYLFVIRGEDFSLDLDFVENLSNRVTKKILYEWDSIKNFDYTSFTRFFDKVISFDMEDAKLNGYNYLPLFYSEECGCNFSSPKYDISFVGSYHDDRDIMLKKIKENAIKNNYTCKFYLYIPFFSYVKNFFKGKRIISPSFFKLSYKKTLKLIETSKAVVDLPHRDQIGATMRTFECLCNKKILVTTNSYLKNESFFNNEDIKIINMDNVDEFDFSFLRNNTERNESNFDYTNYSIKSWLKHVFC